MMAGHGGRCCSNTGETKAGMWKARGQPGLCSEINNRLNDHSKSPSANMKRWCPVGLEVGYGLGVWRLQPGASLCHFSCCGDKESGGNQVKGLLWLTGP